MADGEQEATCCESEGTIEDLHQNGQPSQPSTRPPGPADTTTCLLQAALTFLSQQGVAAMSKNGNPRSITNRMLEDTGLDRCMRDHYIQVGKSVQIELCSVY